MLSLICAGLSLALTSFADEQSTSLIDDEIANTQALIELYEEKLSILNLSNTTDVLPDKTGNTTLESAGLLTYFNDIEKQEIQSKDFAEKVFPETRRVVRQAVNNPYVNLVNEKNYFTFTEVPEKFEWIQVRSITRASSGHQINMALAVAFPGGNIQLFDMWGN